MQVRILHVVDTLESGGLENGVVNIIQRLDPERFEHAVCAVRNLGISAARLPADRVRVMCLNKNKPGFSFQTAALARVIRETEPHVVHSRNWGALEAVLAGRFVRSCALVHSEHGIETSGEQPEPMRRRWFRRLAFSAADQVFAVSVQLRDLHARRTGFPARKIAVIHNGVDVDRFRPTPHTRTLARERFGLHPGEFCIGALGRLEPVKDLWTLLRAAAEFSQAKLAQAGPPQAELPWRLLIAGEGAEREALGEFTRGHPHLQSRVHFLGEIQDVPAFLQALDVYVLPSLFEGISNSLLEAMASGVAVIASGVGGTPEVVKDGESGLLFPAGNSSLLGSQIASLQRDPASRAALGKRATERVREQFSLESMTVNYDRLYSRLAARGGELPQASQNRSFETYATKR